MRNSTLFALTLAALVLAGSPTLAAGPCRTGVCRKAANKCAHAICKPVHGAAKGFCIRAYRRTFSLSCRANAVDKSWCEEVVQNACS